MTSKAMRMNLMQQAGKMPERIAVIAAGIALALCLTAAMSAGFRPCDPAGSAGDETWLDLVLLIGTLLVPVVAVGFARVVFRGRRFRFLLAWLVGALIPWLLLTGAIFFPPEMSECCHGTPLEECAGMAFMTLLISGVINVFAVFVERLLCKLGSGHSRFAAWLQLAAFLSVLMSGMLVTIVMIVAS